MREEGESVFFGPIVMPLEAVNVSFHPCTNGGDNFHNGEDLLVAGGGIEPPTLGL